MKFKEYANKKIIPIVLILVLSFGAIFKQQHTINNLKDQINNTQVRIEERYDYTATEVDKESIQDDINNVCEYKIMSGKANIKHSYVYSREGIFGLNHDKKIVGSAEMYYELTTELKNAIIDKATASNITISVDCPTVNKESCHRIQGTFVRFDDECDQSILSNKQDSEQAMRLWEDTFDIKGATMITDAYEENYNRNELINATIDQITNLFRELGYNQNINVLVK